MAKYVPSKDIGDLQPRIANVIHNTLGYSDLSIVTVIMNCVTAGAEKKKMAGMYSYSIKPFRFEGIV